MFSWVLQKQMWSLFKLLLLLSVLCSAIAVSLSVDSKAASADGAPSLVPAASAAKEKRPGGRSSYYDGLLLQGKRGGGRLFYAPPSAFDDSRFKKSMMNPIDKDAVAADEDKIAVEDNNIADELVEQENDSEEPEPDEEVKEGSILEPAAAIQKRGGGRHFQFLPSISHDDMSSPSSSYNSYGHHLMAKRPGGRAFYGLEDGGWGLRGKRPGGRFFNFRQKRPGGRFFAPSGGSFLFKRLGGRYAGGYGRYRNYY